MRCPTMWYVRPAKAQTSLFISAETDQSLCWLFKYSMTVKLLTEPHLRVLSLKGGCTGSSESTLFKRQYCWKSRITADICVSAQRGYKSVIQSEPSLLADAISTKFMCGGGREATDVGVRVDIYVGRASLLVK